MIEGIFEYINILLPSHRCVTLPGLGAFILNKTDNLLRSDLGNRAFVPLCSISFNSRLQHDDGVLCTYIQSVSAISYEKASKDLALTIKKMRANLLINKKVDCGKLGKLELLDGNIVFTQNQNFALPLHYGLTPVGLKTLSSIVHTADKEVKVFSLKRKLIVGATGTAAAVLLLLPSTSVADYLYVGNEQQAGFLMSLISNSSVNVVDENSQSQPLIEEIDMDATSSGESVAQTEIAAVEFDPEPVDPITVSATVASKKGAKTYYLIVGGEDNAAKAERALTQFRVEGFAGAEILVSPQRYRISIASFDDKNEAERYIQNFRRENPKYESAWIHSVRN